MKLRYKTSAIACLAVIPLAMAQQGMGGQMSSPSGETHGMRSAHGNAAMHDSPDMDTVRQVQQQLQGRGFDPGPVDGIMGPRTRAALRDFQRSKGLTTGTSLDPQTLGALGVGSTGSADLSRDSSRGAAPSAGSKRGGSAAPPPAPASTESPAAGTVPTPSGSSPSAPSNPSNLQGSTPPANMERGTRPSTPEKSPGK